MRTHGRSSGAARSAALLLLLGVSAVAVAQIEPPRPMRGEEHLELVTAAGVRTITIEVASTAEQQAVGLMFRTRLADTSGMLFPHEGERELTMWMKNTYIPLDMVFIRADGTVHRIEAKAEPLSERVISSGGPAAAVLELAGGAAERLGLKAGDKVRHAHFNRVPQ